MGHHKGEGGVLGVKLTGKQLTGCLPVSCWAGPGLLPWGGGGAPGLKKIHPE